MNSHRWLASLLIVLLAGSSQLFGQASDSKAGDAHKTDPSEVARWKKQITFDAPDKSWKQVIDWYSDQTKLPFISKTQPPSEGCDIVVPLDADRKPKKLALPEIHELINNALLRRGLILLRQPDRLILVYDDERDFVPMVRIEELDRLPYKMLARIVVDMKGLRAEEIAPKVKKSMGPFGSAMALEQFKQMMLQDQVVYLRKTVALLKELEERNTARIVCPPVVIRECLENRVEAPCRRPILMRRLIRR